MGIVYWRRKQLHVDRNARKDLFHVYTTFLQSLVKRKLQHSYDVV